MSETQTVTKSSSSSIPANLQTLKLYAFQWQILDQKPEESDDYIPDLVHVDAAASVSVERCEDPVELVLGSVELIYAVSLMEYNLSFYIYYCERKGLPEEIHKSSVLHFCPHQKL